MEPQQIGPSPRIKKFCDEIIKAIPRFPNNRASLLHMQQKHLWDLLVDYVNWRSRYVGIRPRSVKVEDLACFNPRWIRCSSAIDVLLEKVRRGDDLTPHLSIAPHTRGYSPNSQIQGATMEDKWSDKDFLLNAMGYHHFHLQPADEKSGHYNGPDDLIFAEVDRDTFKVIAIFGHSVFDMTSHERERLWAIHQSVAFRSLAPGSVVIASDITTSGHSGRVVHYAQYCSRCLKTIDLQMDNIDIVKSWFENINLDVPKKPNFKWVFNHLDFGFIETSTKSPFLIQKGWN